jgi:hypothetical protein
MGAEAMTLHNSIVPIINLKENLRWTSMILKRMEIGTMAGAVAIAVIAAIVVASLGILFLDSPSSFNPQSIATSTAPSLLAAQSSCASRVPADPILSTIAAKEVRASGYDDGGVAHLLANGSMRKLAFLLLPGAVGTVCVTYTVSVVNGAPMPNASLFEARVFAVNATKDGNGYSFSYTKAPIVSISSNASGIQTYVPRDHSDELTIAYTITASNTPGGVYDLEYPFACPGLTPLAVINSSQTLKTSDFPGFFWPGDCIQDTRVSSGIVTGYSGVSATWLTGYSGVIPPWISP